MTRKEAVDLFCKLNSYDPESSGTWRQQVAVNHSVLCPLYPFRPVPDGFPINTPDEPAAKAALAAILDRRNRERAKR